MPKIAELREIDGAMWARLPITGTEGVIQILSQQEIEANAAKRQALLSDNERLRALLGKLKWKSIDKDNMEFRCDTTCYVMDEIRAALEPKP